MVYPGKEDSEIVSPGDDYLRKLQPELHRYDITLAPDFVISVLPNGIKTWAFIYDFQGRNRRRTLGVFPDMSFAEAKLSLKKSRQIIQRMDEPTVPPEEMANRPAVLGGGMYVPKKKIPRPKWFFRALLGVILLVVISVVIYLVVQRNTTNSSDSATEFSLGKSRPFATTPTTPATRQPAIQTPAKPGRLPFDVAPEKPVDETKKADPPPTSSQGSTLNPGATTVATRDNRSIVPPADRITAAPVIAANNPDTTTGQPQQAAENIVEITRVRNPSPIVTQGVSQTIPTSQATVQSLSPVPAPDSVTAFGGSVARSVLTSRVNNLEPTDILGPEISHRNSGFTRVFYFTELREFSGGHVMHRWQHNGLTIDEVLLKVQKSWRWRTYSNKDLTPGLAGQWRVSTIDATGKILDTEEFTYGLE